MQDARALAKRKLIRLLPGTEPPTLCAFADPSPFHVDADIKALWHAHPPTPRI